MKTKSLPGRAHSRLSRLSLHSLLFLLLLLPASCADHDDPGGGGTTEDQSMTFTIRVPAQGTPKTRAMGATEENTVETIEILLFQGGNYVYGPVYCNSIGPDPLAPLDVTRKSFTAKLPEGIYDVVVLANARQAVGDALTAAPPRLAIGMTKVNALAGITVTNAGKWNATSSLSYTPIPMWGDVGSVTVNAATLTQTVNLLRMVAKVDVTLDAAVITAGNFDLKSVDLYNHYDMGHVVPDAGKWAVSMATIPALAAKPSLNTNHLNYINIAPLNEACVGEIYTFPAEKGTSSLTTNTCLVIGGIYDTDISPTYYRVDFANTVGGVTTYLEILRNHSYEVNISQVLGPGLGTSEEAFLARPVNIAAQVLAWNNSALTDVVFDGQNVLAVSQGEFSFSRDERFAGGSDNKLSVYTDVASGWEVVEITDSNVTGDPSATVISGATGWLNISPDPVNGLPNITEDIYVLVSENNVPPLTPRTGYIHLKAGRLNYVIKVEQSTVHLFKLLLTDVGTSEETVEYEFPAAGGVSWKFRADWLPAGMEATITSTAIGNAFDYTGGGDVLGTGGFTATTGILLGTPGTQTFTITPPAITPAEIALNRYIEKKSKVEFVVTDGVNSIKRNIELRQVNYAVGINGQRAVYMLNGTTYQLYVQGNAGWKITAVTETSNTTGKLSLLANLPGDDLVVGTTGGYNVNPGTAVTFTTIGDVPLETGGTIDVTFESTDNPVKFASTTITLNFGETMYAGYFGGNLTKIGGTWKFTEPLYIEVADEPTYPQWDSTNPLLATGVTDMITGKQNTLDLWTLSLSSTNYPAASLCIGKNSSNTSMTDTNYKWYLPAFKQLLGVYAVRSSFDSAYRPQSNYWSATETGASYAWVVFLGYGSTSHGGKGYTATVRCVREH